ncbi:hypothetical protein P3L51_09040 [Streptomyces sp. PSRA5]|uniref:hypothetical protein n=1 Tax=Streptomyces panacea TaxID=3035064 RepID=UPI00339BC2CD
MSAYIRNGLIKVNPARVTGQQKLCKQASRRRTPRPARGFSDWETLVRLDEALVAAPHGRYRDRGEAVHFVARTAARIRRSPAYTATSGEACPWCAPRASGAHHRRLVRRAAHHDACHRTECAPRGGSQEAAGG